MNTEDGMVIKTIDLTERLNNLIQTMNLPVNRKDCAKPETVKWLAVNMAARNSDHKNFREARLTLAQHMRAKNLLKRKELEEFIAYNAKLFGGDTQGVADGA